MDIIGGGLGSAIGGDIGKAIGGKGKKQRMAGGMDPRLLMMNMPMVNPNTQMMAGMGIADPNRHQVPSFLQDYVKY